jgi:FkbM family methyltransferase
VPALPAEEIADRSALDRLLSRSAEERLSAADLPDRDDPLVLVGAGSLGRETARRLVSSGRAPVAFLDETPALRGRDIAGVPVLGLDDAVRSLGETASFAVTIWRAGHRYLDTRERLTRLGCRRVFSFLELAWSEPGALLPHYAFDLPGPTLEHRGEIERAFDLLADETSRRQYMAHLTFRLTCDHEALPPVTGPAYLDDDLVELAEPVTYVDAGAYDGDTLRAFVARHEAALDRALVFEPDPANHTRLLESVARLDPPVRSRVRCFRAALSDEDGEASINALGSDASAVASDGGEPVETLRLDSVMSDQPAGRTLIKLDVEGHEQAAIQGAERTIRTGAPTVVACLYHRPADLWEIPLLLHSYRPDFRLHIRTEGTDGSDLVCYALPGGP